MSTLVLSKLPDHELVESPPLWLTEAYRVPVTGFASAGRQRLASVPPCPSHKRVHDLPFSNTKSDIARCGVLCGLFTPLISGWGGEIGARNSGQLTGSFRHNHAASGGCALQDEGHCWAQKGILHDPKAWSSGNLGQWHSNVPTTKTRSVLTCGYHCR